MNIANKRSIFNFARRDSVEKRCFVSKEGSDMIFDLVIGFEIFSTLTLPHFFNFVSFLFYVFSSHFIHPFLLITSFNSLIC